LRIGSNDRFIASTFGQQPPQGFTNGGQFRSVVGTDFSSNKINSASLSDYVSSKLFDQGTIASAKSIIAADNNNSPCGRSISVNVLIA
jgi:hypothetical protein